MNKHERVGIICGYPFPEGMAATNRIISYSKGLIENGLNVDVLVFYPKNGKVHKDGVFEGINYYYPSINWSVFKLLRFFLDKILALFSTCVNLYRLNKKNRYDYILISTDALNILFFFVPFVKLLGLKLVFITDEYPIPIRVYLKNKIPKYKEILYRIILARFSGMVFMTTNLSDFYNNICKKPSYILPTITDLTRFNNLISVKKISNNIQYICYMGNLELSKDNVDNIIKAYSLIVHKYVNIELHLYGEPSKENRIIIERLINELNLEKRISLKGRVNYIQVPQILVDSHILVSSQPKTLRAEGGFPTKLGEYLASGVPVLLSNVGEITKYVSDNHTVFICEPDSPIKFANKLSYILDNYEYAIEVGENGREFIRSNFSTSHIGKTFKKYLNSL